MQNPFVRALTRVMNGANLCFRIRIQKVVSAVQWKTQDVRRITMAIGKGGRNGVRRYEGGGPRPDNAAHKREEATARKAEREERGDKAQLDKLDKMFGKGKGARKERARLLARSVK